MKNSIWRTPKGGEVMELTLDLIRAIEALEHARMNEPADYAIDLDGEQE